MSALQRPCALSDGVCILQETAAPPQQILAFRGQLHAAANAVEQGNSKIGFERLNLARGGRQAQIQSSLCACQTSGIDYGDESAKLTKIHDRDCCRFCNEIWPTIAIDTRLKNSHTLAYTPLESPSRELGP